MPTHTHTHTHTTAHPPLLVLPRSPSRSDDTIANIAACCRNGPSVSASRYRSALTLRCSNRQTPTPLPGSPQLSPTWSVRLLALAFASLGLEPAVASALVSGLAVRCSCGVSRDLSSLALDVTSHPGSDPTARKSYRAKEQTDGQ